MKKWRCTRCWKFVSNSICENSIKNFDIYNIARNHSGSSHHLKTAAGASVKEFTSWTTNYEKETTTSKIIHMATAAACNQDTNAIFTINFTRRHVCVWVCEEFYNTNLLRINNFRLKICAKTFEKLHNNSYK